MVDHEGIMTKEGGRYKSWKKRYFVLAGPFLFYFKAPVDFYGDSLPMAQGSIYLPPHTRVDIVDSYKKTKFCFTLSVSKDVRMYYLDALTADDRRKWTEKILHNAVHCQESWCNLFESHVFIAGSPKSGKTSLLKRFVTGSFVHDPSNANTAGNVNSNSSSGVNSNIGNNNSNQIAASDQIMQKRIQLPDSMSVVATFYDKARPFVSAAELLTELETRYEKSRAALSSSFAVPIPGNGGGGLPSASPSQSPSSNSYSSTSPMSNPLAVSHSPPSRALLASLLAPEVKEDAHNPLFTEENARAYDIRWCTVLLVFDLTDIHSFRYIQRLSRDLRKSLTKSGQQLSMMIVGTKSDLTDVRCVNSVLVQSFAERELGRDVPYIEVSSKSGRQIEECFQVLADYVSRTGFARHVPRCEDGTSNPSEEQSDED
eukprot:ANDGO_03269.mRNA.1 PH domain-containing protein DDB_G0274775